MSADCFCHCCGQSVYWSAVYLWPVIFTRGFLLPNLCKTTVIISWRKSFSCRTRGEKKNSSKRSHGCGAKQHKLITGLTLNYTTLEFNTAQKNLYYNKDGHKRCMQQQSRWWKLPSGCAAGANNRGGVYFLCQWVAGTHSHPCMHSTQNTELWTCTNTQSSVGGPTEVLYCAQMLLKFQRIASARKVCFFAKLVSPPLCKNKWKQQSILSKWHMDLLFGANHGAAEPLRPVSDRHIITFPIPDRSNDIFLISSQNWDELNRLYREFSGVFSKMMTSNSAREYSIRPDGSRSNLLFNVVF